LVHSILDDDMYNLNIELSVSISGLEILSINGNWNRWTTPECPRAIPFLQEAVGLCIKEEGFSRKVQNIIGRKACRHHANLLLECCYSAQEAAILAKWEDKRAEIKDLTFEAFLKEELQNKIRTTPITVVPAQKRDWRKNQITGHYARKKTRKEMIIDLHVHTSPASPCSSAPVDQLIDEAKRIGLDGICLTDHNYVWDPGHVEALRERHDFLVLRGNEITTDRGDILVFGLDRDIKGIIKIEELRREVTEAGGFMILAHPFRGFLTFGIGQLGLTPEKAMERPLLKMVDAIEVMNGKVTQKENSFASEVGAGLDLPETGGSDAHEVFEVGVYATQFFALIENEDDLIEALKNGNISPVAFRKEK
jgi:predicted metal-dependent phosphoesterase TrpH